MHIIYILLLSFVALLAIIAGGLVAYYYLDYLTLPQMMLVYAPSTVKFDTKAGAGLAAHFKGTWATYRQFTDEVNIGFDTQSKAAGFVSDSTETDNGCIVQNGGTTPPTAYYTTGKNINNACSRGYYIIGDRTITPPTGMSVLDYNGERSNYYQIKSWKDFVQMTVAIYDSLKSKL